MGIQSFFDIVIAKGPNAGKKIGDLLSKIDIKKLGGSTLCFDASIMIYKSILAMKDPLKDSKGRYTAHLNTILNQIVSFSKLGIKQIWIFDSPKLNPLKEHALKKRRERRNNSTDERVKFVITDDIVKQTQQMMDLLGITYMIAGEGIEAEKLCATLTADGQAAYVVSTDVDCLLFGGNLLYSTYEVSASGKTKKKIYKGITREELLEKTELSLKELVKMSVMLGSDFAPKTPHIGPVKVAKAKLELTEEQELAYNYFMEPVKTKPELRFGEYNRKELVDYLASFDFKRDRVEKILDKYIP